MNIQCRSCHVIFSPRHYCGCPLCAHRSAVKDVLREIRCLRTGQGGGQAVERTTDGVAFALFHDENQDIYQMLPRGGAVERSAV
jgi:hypothetical protein